ncbi:MAG: CoA-binding protein [Acidobacteria bacterium]|nr:MAG: CoA-binding protein [Acidobacteriota bacterium]
MRQRVTKPFPYYVGIYSLEELITKEDKVCVINILGGESRTVTPVSNQYSGGNIVAGVQYGRHGELETPAGNIPVYSSVRDVIQSGKTFSIGVIYLPPAAVSQAAWELVTYNKDLKRIIIITEKVPVKDSRNIRQICQEAGVDVVGANCLGVANAWDHVRIGGALGGDKPEETLKPGSVAIHSNSGNFTTTIAEYLRTSGFGISTAVSSGKDVFIHFALPEFLYAAQNDPRTKAVALYVEPGGYYEKLALDWIKERRFGFNKPIVVCVTGRWKKDIVRSCGHAGAMAGSGDDAESKEAWFDNYFGVPVFDPDNPVVSKKGVRIASIQHFPEAMQAIYKKIDEEPDFDSSGDLNLKLWIKDDILPLPKELDNPVVEALHPYNEQIREIRKQVGASYMQQNMRNRSGASRMDKATQVSQLFGQSILELSKNSVEENIYFAIARVQPSAEDTKAINMMLNLFLKLNKHQETLMDISRENGCSPNSALASQIALIGDQPLLSKTRFYARELIDIIRKNDLNEDTKTYPKEIEDYIAKTFLTTKKIKMDEMTELLADMVMKSKKVCTSLHLCQHILKQSKEGKLSLKDPLEFILASLTVCMFWHPLLQKRISRQVVEDAFTYIYLISQMVACSVINRKENKFYKRLASSKTNNLSTSFTENIFKLLFNRKANKEELVELKYLLGLTLTNGPGTISAKGAKESVSARNHIPTAYVGMLANTGFAHGGNGFEAVAYLLDQFKEIELSDPGNEAHGVDLQALANSAAKAYREIKMKAKATGQTQFQKIPCVNHPVFKGNKVNTDPREEFVRKEMKAGGIYNIFLDFYHHLVKELYQEGVTRNIFCVNVDAVLAVIALKLVWSDFSNGKVQYDDVQHLVFILFLLGRTIGVTGEITDHRDRGQDMDCRTPQSELSFVL